MKIHASGEDYLEAILVLQKKMGMVRSIDLARHMGFSKPSISHAVGVLKNGGFLTVDDDGFLTTPIPVCRTSAHPFLISALISE